MPEIPENAIVVFAFSISNAVCLHCGDPAEILNTAHWTQGGLDAPDGCGATFTHMIAYEHSIDGALGTHLKDSRPDLTFLGFGFLENDGSTQTYRLVRR